MILTISVGTAEKKLTKQTIKFWVCITLVIIVTRLLLEMKFKFKAFRSNYPSKCCLGSISKIFDDVESEEISFKENVHMIFQ